MKKLNLRWIVKESGKDAQEQIFEIIYKDEDDLTDKQLALAQKLVGGYVEVAWIGGDVKVLINEEGLINNLPPNCGFVGTIVFFHDDTVTEWASLDDDEVRKIMAWTAVHGNDEHAGYSMQVISGDENIAAYKKKLQEEGQRRQLEWETI